MALSLARPVSKNAHPIFAHDCDACRFMGRLDGEDLYLCSNGDYIRRFGNDESANGSLGNKAPEGSPYSLIRAIAARKLPPRVYKTVGGA